MAKKDKGATSTAAAAVVEETTSTDTVRYAAYRDRKATQLQDFFGPWLQDQTGYNPEDAGSQTQAFYDGVRLATFLRMEFQASPENKARRAELAEVSKAKLGEREANRIAREAAKIEKDEAAATRKAEALLAKEAKATEKAAAKLERNAAQADEDATPKAAKPTKAAAAAAAAVTPEEASDSSPAPKARKAKKGEQASF